MDTKKGRAASAREIYRANEDGEQVAVIKYCDLMGIHAVHIPNEGKRSAAYGARMKRMGLRKGFPDLFFPIPMGGFHGLFIEMKAVGEKPTAEQRKWIAKLNAWGYRACVCVGADEAICEIRNYLSGE